MPHDSPKLSKSFGASLTLSTPAPNLFLPHHYGWVPLHVGDIFCKLAEHPDRPAFSQVLLTRSDLQPKVGKWLGSISRNVFQTFCKKTFTRANAVSLILLQSCHCDNSLHGILLWPKPRGFFPNLMTRYRCFNCGNHLLTLNTPSSE